MKKKYTSKCDYLGDEHDGYISLVHFDRVKHVLYVYYDASETLLVDNGDKCIVYTGLNAVENGKPLHMLRN